MPIVELELRYDDGRLIDARRHQRCAERGTGDY